MAPYTLFDDNPLLPTIDAFRMIEAPSGSSGSAFCSSEELFDHVNRSVDANLASANGKQPVQEGILRFGRLEARQRTKVRGAWCSVVTNAFERHVDEGAIVGLQRDP